MASFRGMLPYEWATTTTTTEAPAETSGEREARIAATSGGKVAIGGGELDGRET